MTEIAHNDRLAAGVVHVAPTRRLAHFLRARHDAASLAIGLRVWPTPETVTWADLVHRAFEADRDAGRTDSRWLSPVHSRLVWEQIVRSDERLHSVIAPAGVAAMALRSWTLLHEYLIPADALDDAASPEVSAFARWRADYVRWLRRGNWRDAAEAPAEVGPLPAQTRLMLTGFDALTPQQAAFMQRCAAAGVTVEYANAPASVAVPPVVVDCNDFDDEIETATRWAALRLRTSPGQRVAIVVPGLTQERQRVRRIVDRVLRPEATVSGGPPPESAAYELAAARPLAERPVVAAMLAWLGAFAAETDFATCTALLRNAFDRAAADESAARAALDAWLRRNVSVELSVAELQRHAAARGCGELAALLHHGLERARGWARRRLPSQWVREFTALAAEIGWPGTGADSAEQQAVQRWQSLLGEFGGSDDVTGQVGAGTALSHLRTLAANALFEPQGTLVPLVIIDPDTAAGMRFDATWLTGLEATRWPEPAMPDPFLPREWQVRRGVPGASPELNVAAAKRRLERLRRDTGELICSVPAFRDEAPLLPSPLVIGLPRSSKPPHWPEPGLAAATFAARPELERLVDGRLPRIATHEVASGGTSLVQLQASCPFRAAVELRLGGRELEEPAAGIDALERGNIAHAVLKATWDAVVDQRTLGAMTRAERLALVRGHVMRELAPIRATASAVLLRLLDLEQRWLEARVMELLDVDLARPPFAVQHTEFSTSVEAGGLQVRLKLDRVDRLADGSLAVIDYKTGANAAPAEWMGERPKSPQLPLYVRAAGEDNVSAVAFARVRTGATGYKGYARDSNLFTQLQGFDSDRAPFKDYADWKSLLGDWRRRLDGIAAEFREGDARLAPDPKSACLRCHLPGLCRIDESDADDRSVDGDDGA